MKPRRILARILSASLLPALLVSLGFLGCTAGGEDQTEDPAAYALDVKTQVTQMLNSARRNPTNAAFNVGALVGILDDYESQPTGDHEQIYADLLAGCRELKQMYEQSAGGGEINAKIDELLALAGKLPGDVLLDDDPGGEEEE